LPLAARVEHDEGHARESRRVVLVPPPVLAEVEPWSPRKDDDVFCAESERFEGPELPTCASEE
jgi:hypothetical protein